MPTRHDKSNKDAVKHEISCKIIKVDRYLIEYFDLIHEADEPENRHSIDNCIM